ncbi:hypothetical protein Q787_10050 [Ornithobacterium rhinotracheale H06-030791]|nr:hypothetical protein Q785_10215 [Ornithobacterium rhinotracheale ORT-UMN 88]KGB66370.1 hypothetical protein Q787_10050 [Ornithobacterium rhinotracheale H06-030791]
MDADLQRAACKAKLQDFFLKVNKCIFAVLSFQ